MTTAKDFEAMIDADPREFIPWEEVEPHLDLPADALSFAGYLADHRKDEGWSQADTARKLGMSKQLLADYEKARKLPSIEQALRICSVLEMAQPLALSLLLDDQMRRAGVTRYKVRLELAS